MLAAQREPRMLHPPGNFLLTHAAFRVYRVASCYFSTAVCGNPCAHLHPDISARPWGGQPGEACESIPACSTSPGVTREYRMEEVCQGLLC